MQDRDRPARCHRAGRGPTGEASTVDTATRTPIDALTPADACTAISTALGEPMAGLAPERPMGWVLLEHAGPWEDVAARSAAVPAPVRLACAERGLRLQLIRRHGRQRITRPVCLLARTGRSGAFVEQAEVDRLADVLDADLDALAAGRQPLFGRRLTEPVFLACTHGRVDACCARFGRPIARALTTEFGTQVWETTHVGGCRFAANLVCLPEGVYYGRLDPTAAVTAAGRHAAGHLDLAHLRGWAGWPQAAQAADHALRTRVGLTARDATALVAVEGDPGATCSVLLDAGGRRYRVAVASEPLGPPVPVGHGGADTHQFTTLQPGAVTEVDLPC